MTTRSGGTRRHLASSPFQPKPEPVIETFEVGDRVSHDSYGVGRVVSTGSGGVTVDFGSKTVHIASPFNKLERL